MEKPVRLRVGVEGLLDAAGTICCLSTLTGFMESFWWAFDLTSHFRVQYAVGLIGLAAKVLQRTIGYDVGSDHLPVVVDLGFTE